MKKTIYKAFAFVGVTALVILVNACLDTEPTFTDFSKVGNLVEFQDATPGKATALDLADPDSDEPMVIHVRVHQIGPQATNVDLNVGISVSTEALSDYNADASHVVGAPLPVAAYSFPSSVTIKAGKDTLNNANRTTQFDLAIIPSQVPQTPGVNYVIALAITSVSPETTISGNYGYILFNFYHNNFEGDYTVTGTLVDGVAPTLNGTNVYPSDFKLNTINATQSYATSYLAASVAGGNFGPLYHPIWNSANSTPSVYGAVDMIFTIDETTNTVKAVDNYYTDDAPRSRNLRLDEGGINTWDPATKTMKVTYILNENGADRTTFTETWVHK